MEIIDQIEIAKITISLFFLVTASFFDYKERRVPDVLFIVFGVVAMIATSTYLLNSPYFFSHLFELLVYITVSSAVFYGVYYLGFYGGADAILLIILTVIMPWPPSTQTITTRLAPNLPIFSLSIFDNSLIASTFIAPYALLSNLRWKMRTGKSLFENLRDESWIKKLTALLFCIKTEKSKVKPFDMIAEEAGKITLKKVREDDITREEIEKAPENVFIIFSIPMVIFITVGFLISIFLGDMVIFLVKTFWQQLLIH